MAVIPREYQKVGIQAFLGAKGFLLGDAVGLGKTYQALWAAHALPDGPMLFVGKRINHPYIISVIKVLDPAAKIAMAGQAGIFNEGRLRKWFGYPRRRGYLLIHHEALRFCWPRLRALGIWEAVIADEAHRFKNRRAQMTKALKQLHTLHRWAFTGDAMEKSPADFWSLLNWFDPAKFSSYWKFFDAFVEYEDGWFGGREIIGPKESAMPAFAELVSPYYLRREQKDVEKELPEAIIKVVPIRLLPGQRKLYDELDTQTFVDIDKLERNTLFVRNALARITHLTKCALAPGLLGSSEDSAKLQWLEELVKECHEQIVIFTRFREFALGVPIRLRVPAATIVGGMKPEAKDRVLTDFYTGGIQVLCGTYQSIAESLNLHLNCHIVVFTDIHRSSMLMNQAKGRVAGRIGQTEHPLLYYLLGLETEDEAHYDSYLDKRSDIALVNDYLRRHRDGQVRTAYIGRADLQELQTSLAVEQPAA